MSRFRIAAYSLLLLLAVAGCGQKAMMTPERLRELVATPGDNVPLSAKLTAGPPIWTNATATLALKYQSGKAFTEDVAITAKTVGGKYVVYTVQSKLYQQSMTAILTYDQRSGALKMYGFNGTEFVEKTIVFDAKAKTYVQRGYYSDGFTEVTTGSYSATEDCSHTRLYKFGTLFMTRDATNRPVPVPK